MAVQKIGKEDWQSYFDNFSKHFLTDRQVEYAEIRVLSDDFGAQMEANWTLLLGISYDPKDDILDISVDHLNRLIRHPSEIYVDQEEDGWLTSIEVIEDKGTRNIIEIR